MVGGVQHIQSVRKSPSTVESRFNEPRYNKVLDIKNDFLYPNNSKIYKKEPRYNEVLDIKNDFLYPNKSKIYKKEPRYNEVVGTKKRFSLPQ